MKHGARAPFLLQGFRRTPGLAGDPFQCDEGLRAPTSPEGRRDQGRPPEAAAQAAQRRERVRMASAAALDRDSRPAGRVGLEQTPHWGVSPALVANPAQDFRGRENRQAGREAAGAALGEASGRGLRSIPQRATGPAARPSPGAQRPGQGGEQPPNPSPGGRGQGVERSLSSARRVAFGP